ncbi:MAG: hypothetical protein OXH22_03770 [Chloroflexi bacterium]|nr:hypothetical protein [Chloroflexota bacterium]
MRSESKVDRQSERGGARRPELVAVLGGEELLVGIVEVWGGADRAAATAGCRLAGTSEASDMPASLYPMR